MTGPEPSPQPFPQIANLTRDSQWTFVADWGVGVKYRIRDHIILRADFRDYMTPFPKRIFVSVSGGTDRGLFQQFTPMFGVGYSF